MTVGRFDCRKVAYFRVLQYSFCEWEAAMRCAQFVCRVTGYRAAISIAPASAN